MSDYTISIPDSLYEKAQRVAQQTSQSVEDVIRMRLEGALDEPLFDLPADEQAELKAMGYMSDDALFSLMREQMQPARQERMSALMRKHSQAAISEVELDELTALVEAGERLTLRKATAMNLLMERGYDVHLDDMKAADE